MNKVVIKDNMVELKRIIQDLREYEENFNIRLHINKDMYNLIKELKREYSLLLRNLKSDPEFFSIWKRK